MHCAHACPHAYSHTMSTRAIPTALAVPPSNGMRPEVCLLGQDGQAALCALEHVHQLLQPLTDVVKPGGVDGHHLDRHTRGAPEVELGLLVVGLHGEGVDDEVAPPLLDDLERLIDQALVKEMALQQHFPRGPAFRTFSSPCRRLDALRLLQGRFEAGMVVYAERRERRADPCGHLAHLRQRPFDWDGIRLTEKVAVECCERAVRCLGCCRVACGRSRHDLGDLRGSNVGRHRDHAITSLNHVVTSHRILSRVQTEVVAADGAHRTNTCVVAGGILQAADHGVPRECDGRFDRHVHASSPRDVVEDYRKVGRIGDRREVVEQASLGRLDVIRCHDECGVGAEELCLLRRSDSTGRADRAGAHDDR
mmetsp:Transcript_21993/g.56135  ORF Transcript_21993/g.56135 Transcript_21993/m.56135 type:complete len:365 (+) Transcript_21993:205-1299(+)